MRKTQDCLKVFKLKFDNPDNIKWFASQFLSKKFENNVKIYENTLRDIFSCFVTL